MKRWIFAAALILAGGNAWGDGKLSEDISRLLTLVDVGTNGGDTYLFNYDVEDLSYSQLRRDIYKDIDDSECSYQVVIGRRAISRNIGSFASFRYSNEGQRLIQKLVKNGKIKAAIGYYWDGDEGYPEYCSKDRVEFYFENGQALAVEHNSTT